MAETQTTIIEREVPANSRSLFEGLHPVLQRIYASRQVQSMADLDKSLSSLPKFDQLKGMGDAVSLLSTAIDEDWRILVVADYDADGATSCALAVKGLHMLGAHHVDFLVPDRFRFGYGLTPEIVDVALIKHPDLIITVDNGISSIQGVKAAKQAGCNVLVTDHHLPGDVLPDADVIINPNQPHDPFPSKALAGVGVMFYVLMALRAYRRQKGFFDQASQPNLAELLDLVALGTVADVVPLDSLNRSLVHQGLQRIRAGQTCVGIQAMLNVANKEPSQIQASDLGFAIGPRLNAAGRMESMSLGIECLLSNDFDAALCMAEELNQLNLARREVEAQMKDDAFAILKQLEQKQSNQTQWGVCVYDPSWHQGVIGILAARVRQRVHRPVIAFANSSGDEIKGSARSIEGLHIRDVLDDIAAAQPDLLNKFGGHAMAAGLSLKKIDLGRFGYAFNLAVQKRLNNVVPDRMFRVDGTLQDSDLNIDFAQTLRDAGPWGQAFPEPVFTGVFRVHQVRILKNTHLKLVLSQEPQGRTLDGIAFNMERPEQWVGESHLRLVYRLDINHYQGRSSLQMLIDHLEKVDLSEA